MIETLLHFLKVLGLMIACGMALGVLLVIVAAVLMISKELFKRK